MCSRWYTPDLHSHHSYLSICLTVEPKLVPWGRSNPFQWSAYRRRQLASLGRLLQIACQPKASYGIQRAGNHWARYFQPDLWLVTALELGDYRPLCLQPSDSYTLYINDDYLEVWCVPSATHVSCIRRSQNKVFGIRVFVTLAFETYLYF